MSRKKKTFPIGRDANTGRLTTVRKAQKNPGTHVVEQMPKRGRGDTDRGKGKR